MNALTAMGLVCVLGAIVRGGLRALGFELPFLQSIPRQILLAIFGLVLIAAANLSTIANIINSSPVPSPVPSPASSPLLPFPFTYHFEAHSNVNGGTFRKCLTSTDGYHFEDWRIDKSVNGDGDAWFEKAPSKEELCVRADASVTKGGANSGVAADLFATEVPN